MSTPRLDLNPDLSRLRDDGYEVQATSGGHLLLKNVPYVTSNRVVALGTLVSRLTMAGDATANPVDDHVALFAGERPCDQYGNPLTGIVHQEITQQLEPELTTQFSFSAKPSDGTPYRDYHAKMTSYVNLLAGHAQALDPTATARTHRVMEVAADSSPFVYTDTASSRAGISLIAAKLERPKIAIVGLGGSGSYILDLVAKTRVGEIHLFDGDDFLSHNAFRAPGAASLDELNLRPTKVAYFAAKYSVLKNGIVQHAYFVDESNVHELSNMNFVFISMEGGSTKRQVVAELEAHDVPFIDVGLGVTKGDSALTGLVRVTTSTPGQRRHVHDRGRIDFSDPRPEDLYDDNIQVADLNALNAALAVIRWKRYEGFYSDYEHEHFSAYAVDGNLLVNEDHA